VLTASLRLRLMGLAAGPTGSVLGTPSRGMMSSVALVKPPVAPVATVPMGLDRSVCAGTSTPLPIVIQVPPPFTNFFANS